jgi:hypothetical protein
MTVRRHLFWGCQLGRGGHAARRRASGAWCIRPGFLRYPGLPLLSGLRAACGAARPDPK